ncbi:MAG TPA: hypothetical protein VFF69_06780 [Phycisphaerales bacterium]|nr:hypothetical protein [Phycisphaerales bacterium]
MTAPPPARRGPTLYDDLAAGLLWPRLLRAASLAARPQRILLALFLVLLLGALGSVRMPWAEEGSLPFLQAVAGDKLRSLHLIWLGLTSVEPGVMLSGFAHLTTDVTRLMLPQYPVSTFLIGIPALLIIAVLGGAICRSVATEFSQEIVHPWPRVLRFAVERWLTFIGSLALPWIAVALAGLVLAVSGWIFFGGLPVLDVLGAILFGLALLLGLAAVLLVGLSVFAGPLLLPAAACEGSDAIDAAQRAFAYACARPLRLLWYFLVAAVVGLLAVGVVYLLAEGADRFARSAAASWASPSGTAALTGEFPAEASLDAAGNPRELRGTSAAAARAVDLWSSALGALVAAYALSYVFVAGTLVYLFIREVCDGQHHTELWTPGLIESSLEASMRRPADAPPVQPLPDEGDDIEPQEESKKAPLPQMNAD